MDNTVLVAIISGLAVAIPSIITVIITSSRDNALQNERISNIQGDLKKLSDRVDSHNHLDTRLSVLESEVKNLKNKEA